MATLTGNINASVESIRVTGGSAATEGREYRIDDEVVVLRSFARYPLGWSPRDKTRWIVSRGAQGSISTSHSSGATIYATNEAVTTGTTLTPPDPFPTGGGGVADLEAVLAAGNTTGENPIETPSGTITPLDGLLNIIGGEGDVSGDTVVVGGGNGGDAGGAASLTGGTDVAQYGSGSRVSAGGSLNDGSGGSVSITTGDGIYDGDGNGGDLFVTPGAGSGTGRSGLVFLNLPVVDPHVVGALWADSLAVKVSGG
jgi:hypothetical protein